MRWLTLLLLFISAVVYSQQQETLGELMAQYTQAKDADTKCGILARMSAFKDRRVVRFILNRYPLERETDVKKHMFFVLSGLGIRDAAVAVADLSFELNSPEMKSAVETTVKLLAKSKVFPYFVKRLLSKKGARFYEAKLLLVSLLPHEEKKEKENVKILSKLVTEDEPLVRKAVLERLSDYESKDALTVMAKFLKDKEEDIQLLALRILDDYPIRETFDLMMVALKSKYPSVRARAIDALCEGSSEKLLDRFVELVCDDSGVVRRKAVEGLMRLCEEKAIEKLIRELRSATPPDDKWIADALRSLTEKEFGKDAAAWSEWWKKEGSDFRLKPAPRKLLPTFFGTTISSKRVIFIIDVSGSMNKAYKKRWGGEKPHTSLPGEDENGKRKVTKIKMAKKELIGAIQRLERDVKFNIIFYNQKFNAWKQKIIPATYNNKEEAIRFVRNFKAEGRTNIYDTLEFALSDNEVNTIYLLSDGLPNEGAYTEPTTIIEKITEMNRGRRVVINTISFGLSTKGKSFLRELAKRNGGVFLER